MVERISAQIRPMFRPNKYAELRAKLNFQQTDVGQEFMEQPGYVQDIGEHLALCIARRDSLSMVLKEETAKAAAELRWDGDKKVSEAQVKAELDAHPRVIDAAQNLEEAKLDAGLWGALMDSAKTKSSALKHVSELMVSGWLTPNSSVSDTRRAMNEKRVSYQRGS